jgi:hypothetical protein
MALVRNDVSEERIFHSSVCRLLVTVNTVSTLPNLVTLMMEALRFSEMSVNTGAIRRNIPGHATRHSHRRENRNLT